MQQASRQRRIQSLDDALEEIARLPALERRMVCEAAIAYLSSPAGISMMHMLGELPENHPRKFVNKHRLAFALFRLLYLGELPEEVTIAMERWRDLKPV